MGRLLDALRTNLESGEAANPANLANLPVAPSGNSQVRKIRSEGEPCAQGARFAGSQDSQRVHVADLRAHLLTLAADAELPPDLVHGLDDADVAACAGLPDDTLHAYLRVRERGRGMDAGIRPAEYTHAALCDGCGPIWWHAPELLTACPWCFRRKAGKAIPRPHVTCGDCRQYVADTVNPAAGMGGCALGAGRAYWPMKPHRCADWRAP